MSDHPSNHAGTSGINRDRGQRAARNGRSSGSGGRNGGSGPAFLVASDVVSFSKELLRLMNGQDRSALSEGDANTKGAHSPVADAIAHQARKGNRQLTIPAPLPEARLNLLAGPGGPSLARPLTAQAQTFSLIDGSLNHHGTRPVVEPPPVPEADGTRIRQKREEVSLAAVRQLEERRQMRQKMRTLKEREARVDRALSVMEGMVEGVNRMAGAAENVVSTMLTLFRDTWRQRVDNPVQKEVKTPSPLPEQSTSAEGIRPAEVHAHRPDSLSNTCQPAMPLAQLLAQAESLQQEAERFSRSLALWRKVHSQNGDGPEWDNPVLPHNSGLSVPLPQNQAGRSSPHWQADHAGCRDADCEADNVAPERALPAPQFGPGVMTLSIDFAEPPSRLQ